MFKPKTGLILVSESSLLCAIIFAFFPGKPKRYAPRSDYVLIILSINRGGRSFQ